MLRDKSWNVWIYLVVLLNVYMDATLEQFNSSKHISFPIDHSPYAKFKGSHYVRNVCLIVLIEVLV